MKQLLSAMGQGDANSVRAFVSKGRPAMDYTVAMDDPMKQPVFARPPCSDSRNRASTATRTGIGDTKRDTR